MKKIIISLTIILAIIVVVYIYHSHISELSHSKNLVTIIAQPVSGDFSKENIWVIKDESGKMWTVDYSKASLLSSSWSIEEQKEIVRSDDSWLKELKEQLAPGYEGEFSPGRIYISGTYMDGIVYATKIVKEVQ